MRKSSREKEEKAKKNILNLMLWKIEEITNIKIRRFQIREIKIEMSKYLKKSENKFLRIFFNKGSKIVFLKGETRTKPTSRRILVKFKNYQK